MAGDMRRGLLLESSEEDIVSAGRRDLPVEPMPINIQMTGNKYKRTNLDDDESTAGTPPGRSYEPHVVFKASATFWHSRSILEKGMFILVLIFLLVVLILAILLSSRQGQQMVQTIVTKETKVVTPKPVPPPKSDDICLSPQCIKVAARVLESMDLTAEPCDDFFTYSCGNWIKNNPIPEGHARWETFSKKLRENQMVMKYVLDNNETATCEAERKAQVYYRSCLDRNDIIEKLGAQPLLDLVDKIGGWHILNKNWSVKDFKFQDLLESVVNLDIGVFFAMWVGVDEKNSSRNILQMDQSGIGLPSREYYVNKSLANDTILQAYHTYMIDTARLMGCEDDNRSKPILADVIEFEAQIAEITVPVAERRDEEKLYHKMTVKDVQEMAPFIDWLHVLNSLFRRADVTLKEDEEVVVYAPEFIKSISTMVADMLKTDQGKITLHNYMMWHVVKVVDAYLDDRFDKIREKFKAAISGSTGRTQKWRDCVTDVDSTLGFALGAMFVRQSFHGESKAMAEDMVNRIRTQFKLSLTSLPWMDPQTVKAADEKADAVIDMIGYPNYIMNKTALDLRYKNLTVTEDEYFANNMRSLEYSMIRELSRLRQAPDRKRWVMTPPTINAYYAPTKNMIVFPAGILQAPFYDQDHPRSLNFGGIGVVVGHELTHGFDDQGREYDKNGNLRPWWNKDVVKKFKKKIKCMIDQYSSYQINGENINGQQTVGENIADNGGLKASLEAYRAYVLEHGEERLLPGLNLTQTQLFFLGFGQVWCSSATKEAYHLQIISDAHTPAKFRVIGTLSNSRDFAKAFNCPVGSRMNPKKKCKVW